MKKTLNLIEIKKLIPHREPMLLVDKVTTWEENQFIEATRRFKKADIFFKGHFPGMPVLPGIVMVEAMAQCAALLTSLSGGYTSKTATYLFMAIDDVKFKTMLKPGQTLLMRAEKEFEKLGIFRYKTVATVDGKIAAQATVTAKLILKKA